MLRIATISESVYSVTITVEGRLVSEWVAVLEQECLQWLREKREVLLDFSGVTFVDHHGVSMLKRIGSPNLRLVNCPALLADILNESDKRNEKGRT